MTPPPPREGDYTSAPPAGVRRPTQPVVGGDTTAPWVRDKLAEGERVYGALMADHRVLAERTDGSLMAIKEDISEMREQMSEDRRDHRKRDEEVREEIQGVDERLDGIAETQAAQGVEIRSHGEQLVEIRGGQKDQGAQLALILQALESAKAVAADRAANGQGASPDGGALVPPRQVSPKQAIVGGSVLSTALAVIGATVKLPPVLQWAVAVALVVVVATASWVAAKVLIKRLG